jgi:hypothetical protein
MTINTFFILIVIAIVLCVAQAMAQYRPPAKPTPHWGWLAFAFVLAAFLVHR